MDRNHYMESAGVRPTVRSSLSIHEDLMEKIMRMDEEGRLAMLKQYGRIGPIMERAALRADASDDQERKLAMANTLLWALYETGTVSRQLALCFLPYGHYDDYFHACSVVARDGMFTATKPMKWLRSRWEAEWKDGNEAFSPENLHHAMAIHRAAGPDAVPDDAFEPGADPDRLRKLAEQYRPEPPVPEKRAGPRWLLPNLKEKLEEAGITDDDLPATVEIRYVDSSFGSDVEAIQSKTIKKLHRKWAKFCTEACIETECVESVAIAKPGRTPAGKGKEDA